MNVANFPTVPACLLRGPGGVNPLTPVMVVLCYKCFRFSKGIQLGTQFQASSLGAVLGSGDALPEVVKIPASFVGGRGTLKKDHLKGIHWRQKGMDNSHGDILVVDVCIGVRNFFIKLVSCIDVIKPSESSCSDVLVVVSGMEFSDSTFRFILCFQGAIESGGMALSIGQNSLFDLITKGKPNSLVSIAVFGNP